MALLSAIGMNDIKIVRDMIDKGYDAPSANADAVEYAIRLDRVEIVELLLRHGANINSNNGGCIKIAFKEKNLEIFKILIKFGANINVVGDYVDQYFTDRSFHCEKYHYVIKKYLQDNIWEFINDHIGLPNEVFYDSAGKLIYKEPLRIQEAVIRHRASFVVNLRACHGFVDCLINAAK